MARGSIGEKGVRSLAEVLVFGIIWIVLTVIAEYALHPLASHFYIYTASNTAVDAQKAAAFIFSLALVVFVFFVLFLIYAPIRFRARKNETGNSKVQTKFSKGFVFTWFVISLIVNVFLFVHPTASAMQTYFNAINSGEAGAASSNPAQQPLIVDVVERQWEWVYSYPQYGLTQTVNSSGNDTLYLPVNRPVEFVLRSYDQNHYYDPQAYVIHSFWVPAFGIKTDVIPGLTRYEFVTPTKISSTETNQMVRVQCAEVCGPGHPYMETNLHIVSPSDFATWVQQQKKLESGS